VTGWNVTPTVAVIAALTVGLAACSSTVVGPSSVAPATTPPAKTAQQMIQGGIDALKGASYDVTDVQAAGETAQLSIDGTKNILGLVESGTVSGVSVTLSFIFTADMVYAKLDLGNANQTVGIDPTKWYVVDRSKVTSTAGMASINVADHSKDTVGVGDILAGATGLTKVDDTHVTGTIDETKITGPAAPSASDLTKAGAGANSVPLTATFDSAGRFTEFDLTPTDSAAKDVFEQKMSFSDYGSPTPVTLPAASVTVPAPPVVYSFFNQS
jgi:hypothetical protein